MATGEGPYPARRFRLWSILVVALLLLALPLSQTPATRWTNATRGSSSGPARFSEGSGTIGFAVTHFADSTDNPGSGSVVVAGTTADDRPTLNPLPLENYTVTFEELGLSLGTAWSVSLAGTTETSNGSTVLFSEPNGSYAFVVGPIANHFPSPASGSVTVNGSAQLETVHFEERTCCPAPSPFWGLFGAPGYNGLIFLLFVAFLILVGTAGAFKRRKRKPPIVPSDRSVAGKK